MEPGELEEQLRALGEISHRFDWHAVDRELMGAAVQHVVQASHTLYVAPVGYGMGVQVRVYDRDGRLYAAVVMSAQELNVLLRMIGTPEGVQALGGMMTKPPARRRR